MEEKEEELILGTRKKVEINNREETMKFLSAWALQSLQLYPHPHAGTHTPPCSYIRTTLHIHTHTPLHTLTHTAVTPTHAHPSNYIRTTCAHPYTYVQISTNINSLQLSHYLFTNISKYPHMHTFTNIHTVTLQYLSIVQMHKLLLLTVNCYKNLQNP